MDWLSELVYGKKRSIKKNRDDDDYDFKFDGWDHRFDDHPSWYTDDKREQRKMIENSRKRRKENWD